MTIVLVLIASVYVLVKSGLLDDVFAPAQRSHGESNEPEEPV